MNNNEKWFLLNKDVRMRYEDVVEIFGGKKES